MSKKRKSLWVLIIFIALMISGCQCSEQQIDIMQVFNDSPLEGEVITTLLPTFTYHNSEDCKPDRYWIRYADSTDTDYGTGVITPDGDPAYTLTNPLVPGREYLWRVKAEKKSQIYTSYSEPSYFYTGPVCSGEALIAPDLQQPGPAAWLEEQKVFSWTYAGGCLPLSYDVQFARDAAFTDIYLTATTTEPYAQHMLMAFPDCSSMFWRVRASDGVSSGPWSEARDFHYVISGGCYQWHYLSDDFAWLYVSLYKDLCDQTGYIAAWTESLNSGCKVDGTIIVGSALNISHMNDFTVNLGAGPCPSAGLDMQTADWSVKFGVITPGTYCLTISRDQTADHYGEGVNLLDGIWTKPRTNQVLAQQTIELGPGVQSLKYMFVWDEIDRPFLAVPLDYTYDCKLGPEKICPTYDFAPAGEMIPILGRDRNSDWKLVGLNSGLCYINLPDALIADYLAEYGPQSADLENLGYFVPPDPCDQPEVGPQDSCAKYTDRTSCSQAGCLWHPDAGGFCTSR